MSRRLMRTSFFSAIIVIGLSECIEADTAGLYRVGEHRLYLECAGSGTPTIILEHGEGQSLSTWDAVWSDLGRMTHVCRYDRANRGKSDPGPVPTTSGQLVHDLRELLRVAQVKPPLVLV